MAHYDDGRANKVTCDRQQDRQTQGDSKYRAIYNIAPRGKYFLRLPSQFSDCLPPSPLRGNRTTKVIVEFKLYVLSL